MVVSLYLFLNNPDLTEGQLTSVIHGVVSNETLAIICSKNDFVRYTLLPTLNRRVWNVRHGNNIVYSDRI